MLRWIIFLIFFTVISIYGVQAIRTVVKSTWFYYVFFGIAIIIIGNFLSQGKTAMVVLDNNQTPVDIEDLQEFYDQITTRWFESVNEYHRQHTELANKRKVHKLVD